MVKGQNFLLLGLVFVMGCGTGGDLQLDTPPPASTNDITVKGGKDGINVIHGTDAASGSPTVRYLGEIENNAKQPSCYINITFSTLGSDGKPIDQGLARSDLNGFTLTNFDTEIHTCLKPGQFGSFDTGEITLSPTNPFSDFQFKRCFISDDNIEQCQFLPLAQDPRVPLVVIFDQVNGVSQNSEGKRVFNGIIRNNAPSGSNLNAYNASIVFTILDQQGKVIDTKEQSIGTSKVCQINGNNAPNCIQPGDEINFSTATDTLVEKTCITIDTCFYPRIHHSE